MNLSIPGITTSGRPRSKRPSTFPNIRARKLTDTLIGSAADHHSVADWEKKAADIRKSVEWMLGDKTPGTLANPFPLPKLGDTSQPAAPPRGGRGGAAAATSTRRCSTTSTAQRPDGNSYGWIDTAVQQTTKRKITFPSPSGFGAIEADLFTPNNVAAGRETADRHLAAWLQLFARL